jgi:hypothetical protein
VPAPDAKSERKAAGPSATPVGADGGVAGAGEIIFFQVAGGMLIAGSFRSESDDSAYDLVVSLGIC